MSLTFRDYVTSSVTSLTWPFDSHYWRSFGTKTSEIFNGECEAMIQVILNDL